MADKPRKRDRRAKRCTQFYYSFGAWLQCPYVQPCPDHGKQPIPNPSEGRHDETA